LPQCFRASLGSFCKLRFVHTLTQADGRLENPRDWFHCPLWRPHGYVWDRNTGRWVQTHRTEADNGHVRIRPDPIPGYPMEDPEPTPEEYERLHAEVRKQHVEWRMRAGYYCALLYEPMQR
jgi:hypothetical protein